MMKKIFTFVLTLTIVFTLVACENGGSLENGSSTAPSQTEEVSSVAEETSNLSGSAPQAGESSRLEVEAGSNALVVYFSWSGNTASVANEIQAQTGAEIFEIVPENPYTDDYNTMLDIAQEEQADNARPAIAEAIENFAQYDVVYLGFPNWWGDMPMILYTFLEEYDFSGKTIAPFVTSGGSGFSNTLSTIASMEPNATVTEGLSPGSSTAADSGSDVTQWLSGIGLME